ncbi:MAG: zinc ribbon domain-containing protein [Erysipelotrichales bacterium]|nr:zinc ribbon domain-containing protein [Erysipelotrichales bacterium]MBQ4374838.1 zinc ribbon domain-containing protein [Erysipelotrichales bacterium]
MFLIMTVTEKSEQLDFHQVTECENCGRVGAVEVFMIYRCFCLFFLPVWKFDRRYYAKMNCCGAAREIPRETGEAIRRGEEVFLDPAMFRSLPVSHYKECPVCGYRTEEDFDYCPKCGNPLTRG